jgi:hypothetical protein
MARGSCERIMIKLGDYVEHPVSGTVIFIKGECYIVSLMYEYYVVCNNILKETFYSLEEAVKELNEMKELNEKA